MCSQVLSEEPLFSLASVDLCEVDAACPNIARFLPSIRCGCQLEGFSDLFSDLGLLGQGLVCL